VSQSDKFIKLKERVVGILMYGWLVRGIDENNGGCNWHPKHGARIVLGTEPSKCES
jgi:hypothetical protein